MEQSHGTKRRCEGAMEPAEVGIPFSSCFHNPVLFLTFQQRPPRFRPGGGQCLYRQIHQDPGLGQSLVQAPPGGVGTSDVKIAGMVVVSRKKDRMFWEPPNDLGKLWKPPSTVSEDPL